MFNNVKNNRISKLGQFARCNAALAAAAAATLSFCGHSFGAFTDITSITTQIVVGSQTTVSNVSGAGDSYSLFQSTSPNSPYTIHYNGEVEKVTQVMSAGKAYNATAMATAVVKRGPTGGNNDTLWYVGSYNGSTISLAGPQLAGFNAAFESNNLLVGADNLFSNEGNAVGNNTNVDRLDIMFNKFTASDSNAFTILDRGPTHDHDAFKIAAITAVDANGNPTAYGPLHAEADGAYGTTDLVAQEQEMILRKNDSIANDPYHPSDSTGQPIGGVLIPSSSLVSAGTSVYGYSLFSNAVPLTDTSAQLVNYATLPTGDSTSNGGGLDAVATAGVLYTAAVPEPTTGALMVLAAGGMLSRRGARKQTV